MRKTTKTKTPKTGQGQTGKAIRLDYSQLTERERQVMLALNAGQVTTLGELAAIFEGTGADKTSTARNQLRRLVRCGFVEKADRGAYVLTMAGHKAKPKARTSKASIKAAA